MLLRLAVLAVLPLALAGCRSAVPLLASAPAVVTVDGGAEEWATGVRPVPGQAGLSLGLRNTPDALVVLVVAGDEWQAQRLAAGGLTLWLDPAGGSTRRAGLRFPVGTAGDDLGDLPPDATRPDSGPLRDAFEANTTRLETVRDGDARPAAVGSIAGVETAATWTPRGLVVEVRLPLRGPAAAAFAGEATGTTVGLGIEMAEIQRRSSAPPPSLTGRSADGRIDGYGADRQSGRETAAPQDPARRQTAGTTTTWIGVALAP